MICKIQIQDENKDYTLRTFAGNFELIYENNDEITIKCMNRIWDLKAKEVKINENGTIITIII